MPPTGMHSRLRRSVALHTDTVSDSLHMHTAWLPGALHYRAVCANGGAGREQRPHTPASLFMCGYRRLRKRAHRTAHRTAHRAGMQASPPSATCATGLDISFAVDCIPSVPL